MILRFQGTPQRQPVLKSNDTTETTISIAIASTSPLPLNFFFQVPPPLLRSGKVNFFLIAELAEREKENK